MRDVLGSVTRLVGSDVEVRNPFEVLVPAEECALREDSVALCSQIRTISIEHRITENLGSIPQERMDEVDTALEYSLGLTEI